MFNEVELCISCAHSATTTRLETMRIYYFASIINTDLHLFQDPIDFLGSSKAEAYSLPLCNSSRPDQIFVIQVLRNYHLFHFVLQICRQSFVKSRKRRKLWVSILAMNCSTNSSNWTGGRVARGGAGEDGACCTGEVGIEAIGGTKGALVCFSNHVLAILHTLD